MSDRFLTLNAKEAANKIEAGNQTEEGRRQAGRKPLYNNPFIKWCLGLTNAIQTHAQK